jgi:microcin C transport system permease protein
MVAQLEQLYGFDRPVHERYFKMLWDFARLDFGESYYKGESVLALIADRLPVSISLGLWTTLLTYLVALPLGIRKAVRAGTRFDAWTSFAVTIGYAIPGFLFAVLLVVLFAGGNFWNIFPSQGLVSENWQDLSWPARILDYAWHMVLPVSAMVIGAFASLTMLTKNSILDEIGKQYVTTARAKGQTERGVLYGHVFRNAMLIVIAGFPAAFVGVLFTSSLLIEVIFSLDGLGLLGFEATINRDYPVMLGSLFIFSLVGLLANLLGDITYTLVDPRIDFARRDV